MKIFKKNTGNHENIRKFIKKLKNQKIKKSMKIKKLIKKRRGDF